MDLSLVAFLAAALAATALPFLMYRRRELQVRGRTVLAALRAGVLVLALLLLWNPQLPGRIAPQGASDSWVLLDRSVSMSVTGDEGGWEAAARRARSLAGSQARIATFGDRVQVMTPDEIASVRPDAASSRLAGALERAAEAGARSIVVVSDLRIPDGQAATAVVSAARAQVRFEVVPSAVRNVGAAEFVIPRSVPAEEPVSMDVVLRGEGGGPSDSVTVEVREDGRLVATDRATMPAAGRQERLRLVAPSPAREGRVRYTVRTRLEGDRFEDDDERVAYVDVGPEVRGVVLVSLRPTWEPRFVLPVLEQVTGLGATGYLRLSDGRYLTSAPGAAARPPVSEAEVREALGAAALVVVHGAGSNAPEWLGTAVARASRVLVFADDSGGAALAGVTVVERLAGEWYAAREQGSSPLAGDLAGASFAGLPPLSGLLVVEDSGGVGPLLVERPGGGRREPALALVRDDGRRSVAVLASGFWRWGFRDGDGLEAYRRLWAAVSGWLLANEAIAGGPGVRPAERVIARSRPIRWVAPGLAGDTVQVTLRMGGEVVHESTEVVTDDETFATPPLQPGTYEYVADRGPGRETEGSGVLDVERFTDELLIAPASLDLAAGDGASGLQAAGIGRPLRTHPLPYLLLLGLLCVEWIGRRRLGLR